MGWMCGGEWWEVTSPPSPLSREERGSRNDQLSDRLPLSSRERGLGGEVTPRMLPTPAQRFGHQMGAERQLVRWADMRAYFHDLAAASDRLRYQQLGAGTEGQPLVLLTISSPENLARLDELRAIQA